MNTFDLAFNEPGNPIPIIIEGAEYPTLDDALANNHGYHEATDEEVAIYERYWNAVHEATWTPSSGADAEHRDQEIDLGDGWWAVVGDEGSSWSWEVNDHWLRDEAPSVAEGHAADEGAAKRAALQAYASAEHKTPTEPLRLPLPNDKFEGRIVIASTWAADDPADPPRLATVLLLNPIPPYYTVAQLVAPEDVWLFGEHEDFPNVNPAVTDGYAEWGGDY